MQQVETVLSYPGAIGEATYRRAIVSKVNPVGEFSLIYEDTSDHYSLYWRMRRLARTQPVTSIPWCIMGAQYHPESRTMENAHIEDLPHYVYEDYAQWEGKWELIRGIPYAMTPAPSLQHQRISHKIDALLANSLKECEQCEALLPVDWKIDEDTVVQPDNLVVCGKPDGKYLTKAPALIFEILSKSTAAKDKSTKFSLYEKAGVTYYIIVDPIDQIAMVYRLHENQYINVIHATDEQINFELKECQLNFDFSRIWA